MDKQAILAAIEEIAQDFAAERGARQLRRELQRDDFARLAAAGFLHLTVPVEMGGTWSNTAESARYICAALRIIAQGDSSVALVCAMHPLVQSYWLATPEAPAPYTEAWAAQRRWVFQTALDGHWWGTVTSEPGSGGDITRTAATARHDEGGYRISGRKQFGSGLGLSSYMITTAIPAGELSADWFYVDLRARPWEHEGGVKIVAPWDGHGMIASQSHAVLFDDYPATRIAWPGHLRGVLAAASAFILACFTAVTTGIVDVAMVTAHRHLAPRQLSLRAFDRVEWAHAETEAWLIRQAYEGMLRAIEHDAQPNRDALIAKTAVAELAEAAMQRVCKVLGGGTYARLAPYGFWLEDVRALGFLRPPWGLAYDLLFDSSWSGTE